MPEKHIIDGQRTREIEPNQGIIVPLDLPEFEILSQCIGADESIEVQVRARKESQACPRCGEESAKVHDTRKRVKRDVTLRGYQVYLIIHKRRFRCATCRKPFTEKDSACGRYKRTTERFRDLIAKQACQRPIAHVAQEVQVGPRFVHDCLSDGRKKEEVVKLLERLSDPDAVKVVSMDMSASFRPAVQAALPKAQIVVDHFHVIQHVMKAFRKVLSSWAHKKEGIVLLHGKQHLFLRAKEDLTEEDTRERAKIGARLPALEKAWQLKEALRTWYATATVADAAQHLDAWIKQVQQEGPDALQKALSPFKNWRQEILAFFQFLPILVSNGFVEGKNNRTKTMMRQAYGYRNRYNLRMRILLGADI